MNLGDLLGGLGQAAPSLLQGYTGGQLAGTQAKLQALQQQKQDQFKREQFDLQKMRLLQDKDTSGREQRDRNREMLFKYWDATTRALRDPQTRYEMGVQGTLAPAEQEAQELAGILFDPNADLSTYRPKFPGVMAKVSVAPSAMPQQGPEAQPQRIPHLNPDMAQLPLIGGAFRQFQPRQMEDGSSFAQFPAELLPPQPETIQQQVTRETPSVVPAPPKYAADVEKTKQETRKTTAQADIEEERALQIADELGMDLEAVKALIAQRKAAAGRDIGVTKYLGREQARKDEAQDLREREQTERERANKADEAIRREQLARQKALDAVDIAYKKAKTKKTLADWQKIKTSLTAVGKTIKMDDVDKAELKVLQERATSTSKITGKKQVNPEFDKRLQDFMQRIRTKYKSQLPGGTPAATPATKAGMPTKLSDFFPDDVAEVKRNLRNFDAWVNTLDPDIQETARAIRGFLR